MLLQGYSIYVKMDLKKKLKELEEERVKLIERYNQIQRQIQELLALKNQLLQTIIAKNGAIEEIKKLTTKDDKKRTSPSQQK